MYWLKFHNLSVLFATPDGPLLAVDGVSLELCSDEILALVGETGCGKSVLAHAVLRLLPRNAVTEGAALFKGRKGPERDLLGLKERELVAIRAREIAIVFQNPALALNPLYTIGRQIGEIYRAHQGASGPESLRLAASLLERMGFKNPDKVINLYPFQMSEGMNQRVLIAAAFALNPCVIIADEPTKGLDDPLKEEVIRELQTVKTRSLETSLPSSDTPPSPFNRTRENSSLFLITHDLDAARRIADRIAVMYAGEIVEQGHPAGFFKDPLHPYSKALLESLPERGFKPVRGAPPSMLSPPSGCRFHPRCPQKMEVCSSQKPELLQKPERDVRCHLYR